MLRRLGHTMVFLAMFSIAGGHWAVLKSVAWAGMIVSYSQESTLARAVVKTFSGQAPCDMCRAIETGQQKESRLPATAKAEKKFDSLALGEPSLLPDPAQQRFSYPLPGSEVVSGRCSSPPDPVPKTA